MQVTRLGSVDYLTAWELQRGLHARRVADEAPDTVLLLEHPSVYTAGRRTQAWERPTDGSEVIDVDRGGRLTWHGPGQLVGYPVVRLPDPVDVVAYVRALEETLIRACAEFSLDTVRVPGRSGVWVRSPGSDRKIAAIGVRVSRGVTMHGFALNVCPDLSAYDRIVPCGITDATVTSLTRELHVPVDAGQVRDVVEEKIVDVLGAHISEALRV